MTPPALVWLLWCLIGIVWATFVAFVIACCVVAKGICEAAEEEADR